MAETPDKENPGGESSRKNSRGVGSAKKSGVYAAVRRRRRLKALRGTFRRFMLSPFGWVFAVGVAMMTLWALGLFLVGYYHPPGPDEKNLGLRLFKMSATHLFTGRAAGIAYGEHLELSKIQLILTATYLDIMYVFTFFPMLAFGYRSLARLGVFGEIAQEAVLAAQKSQPTVAKYGIVGLFLFVVFPLYSTGPLIGALIGFFIGLPLVVNLLVVVSGTAVAITIWVLSIDWISGVLGSTLGESWKVLPLLVAVAVVGLLILLRVRKIMKNRELASGVRPAVDYQGGGKESPSEKEDGGEPNSEEGD